MRMIAAIVALALSGCATTPEDAAAMSDRDLCWAKYDRFSISGRTERAIGAEVERRGLNCDEVGKEFRAWARSTKECTTSIRQGPIFTHATTTCD